MSSLKSAATRFSRQIATGSGFAFWSALLDAAAPAGGLARTVASAPEDPGKHVRFPVDHVGVAVAARGDQADVFGDRRMGRDTPTGNRRLCESSRAARYPSASNRLLAVRACDPVVLTSRRIARAFAAANATPGLQREKTIGGRHGACHVMCAGFTQRRGPPSRRDIATRHREGHRDTARMRALPNTMLAMNAPDIPSRYADSFSHGGGCGCKIAPGVLQEILAAGPALLPPALLVGIETSDDAAVYQHQRAPGHRRDHGFLHADRRRSARLRRHRRDQRDLRRLRDGRHAAVRPRARRHAGQPDAGRDDPRRPRGRRGGLRARGHSRSRAATPSTRSSRSTASSRSASSIRDTSSATPARGRATCSSSASRSASASTAPR